MIILPIPYSVRDVWAHKDLGEWTAGTYTPPAAIPNNDVFMIQLSPKPTVSTLRGFQPICGMIQFDKSGKLTVNTSQASRVRITVSDLNGRVVYSHLRCKSVSRFNYMQYDC